jgi:hypothetical protein
MIGTVEIEKESVQMSVQLETLQRRRGELAEDARLAGGDLAKARRVKRRCAASNFAGA